MAIADTITSMQNHTSNAYTMIGYGTDLTGINKNLENLSTSIFNAFLEALRNPDTLFTNLPKKSGTGSVISLNDTANAPMRIELGASELSQAETPTPSSPQEVHTISGSNKIVVNGKNLLDTQYFQQGSINSSTGQDITNAYNGRGSNYIPVQPNTIYTISTNVNVDDLRLSEYNSSKGHIQRDSSSNSKKLTITTSATTYYVRWSLNYNNSTQTSQTLIDSLNLQLELGNTATTYEPYTSQEAEIDLTSKNLFNRYAITTGKELNNDGSIGTNQSWYVSDYIPVQEGKYYVSKNVSSNTKCWYDSTKTFISRTTTQYALAPTNAKYLLVNGTLSSYASNSQIQVEEGQTPTDFEEYFTPIDYSKISTYEDKFIRTSGKNLFDGSTITPFNANTVVSFDNETLTYKNNNSYDITVNLLTLTLTESTNIYALLSTTPTNAISVYSGNTYVNTLLSTSQTSNNITLSAGTYTIKTTATTNGTLTLKQLMISKENASYEPYGNGTWYIKKNIGKYVFTGNETFSNTSTRTNTYRFTISISDKLPNNTTTKMFYCNRGNGTPDAYWSTDSVGICEVKNATQPLILFSLPIGEVNSTATAQTWLLNNLTKIKYVLATPTYTQITGTLAEQLEQVYKNMLSQKEQTNISQVNNDLSFNMSVQAIEEV